MDVTKKAHISIDDCMPAFQELTRHEEKYDSIFEVDFLKGLKFLHDKYDVVFSLYFWEYKSGYSILQITDRYQKQFQECKDWLKFGFHGSAKFDYLNSDCGGRTEKEFMDAYTNTMAAIEQKFSSEAKTNLIRLHRYVASPEEMSFLKKQNVKGILAAHDNRVSYDLSEQDLIILNKSGKILKDEMLYLKTDFCLDEMQEEIFHELEQRKEQEYIVLFIHEKVFCKKIALLEGILKWCKDNHYIFINELE